MLRKLKITAVVVALGASAAFGAVAGSSAPAPSADTSWICPTCFTHPHQGA